MSLWWLSCSPEVLRAAETCRVCGSHDADCDIGLCYECYCREYGYNHQYDEQEKEYYQSLEDENQKYLELEYQKMLDECYDSFNNTWAD